MQNAPFPKPAPQALALKIRYCVVATTLKSTGMGLSQPCETPKPQKNLLSDVPKALNQGVCGSDEGAFRRNRRKDGHRIERGEG
jgi:hypothetical protein